MEQKVSKTSSFCNKNAQKALENLAFTPSRLLVRMRSAVRICVDAPEMPVFEGKRAFFVAKSYRETVGRFFDPHRDPHAEISRENWKAPDEKISHPVPSVLLFVVT